MARRAFFSFHYKADNWRASKVRNIGVVEGNRPCTDNQWEAIKAGGDARIKQWIEDQLRGKSVAIVLIGSRTAGRKWIKYEIRRAWRLGNKGVMGIHVHNLDDRAGRQSAKGRNPFSDITIDGKAMDRIVRVYDPPRTTSKGVYSYINQNLANWIERAIEIRGRYA